MHDIAIAAIALFGVVIVAASGYKFISLDDERFERIALGSAPALWTEATADEVMSR